MDASIVVCTYNRSGSLGETIDAICGLDVPGGIRHEVIIVDNNSTDQTAEVVRPYLDRYGYIRYVFEEKQGLSNARNRGIAESRGATILFTDDDVLPERDWLVQTLDGMAKHGADACGGFISPIFETPPPAWLTARFHGFLAVRDARTDDYVIAKPADAPFGANMAFRRQVFDRVGPFDTSRGRKGNTLASGEDGELFDRLLRAGIKAVFLGRSRVRHKVEAYRLEKRYFRRWRYQTSRNIAFSKGIPGTRRLFNVPHYFIVQTARSAFRALIARLTRPEDEAFMQEIILWHFLGTIRGLVEARRK
ncbi:glycosyltransferase [Thauera sinica]|uniref:Glycosyltransferase n=1 Tax=Thauera sinica TaxID=2665146 RepID=A0ABW1AM29_9RHOO|nr:glycosyltransferase [Thauera sp. K11]ATE60925.1 glycosyl transferase family 2 [Thauera sp. K11]